jgi:hypothetical protein
MNRRRRKATLSGTSTSSLSTTTGAPERTTVETDLKDLTSGNGAVRKPQWFPYNFLGCWKETGVVLVYYKL